MMKVYSNINEVPRHYGGPFMILAREGYILYSRYGGEMLFAQHTNGIYMFEIKDVPQETVYYPMSYCRMKLFPEFLRELSKLCPEAATWILFNTELFLKRGQND